MLNKTINAFNKAINGINKAIKTVLKTGLIVLKDSTEDKVTEFLNSIRNNNIPSANQSILYKALTNRNNLLIESMFNHKETKTTHSILDE